MPSSRVTPKLKTSFRKPILKVSVSFGNSFHSSQNLSDSTHSEPGFSSNHTFLPRSGHYLYMISDRICPRTPAKWTQKANNLTIHEITKTAHISCGNWPKLTVSLS